MLAGTQGHDVSALLELACALAALFLSVCTPNLKRVEACESAYRECVGDATTKAEYFECRDQVDRECDHD